MERRLRPDDVGRTLTLRCSCGCLNDGVSLSVTGYQRGLKSNVPASIEEHHDLIRAEFNDGSGAWRYYELDQIEVVDEHQANP